MITICIFFLYRVCMHGWPREEVTWYFMNDRAAPWIPLHAWSMAVGWPGGSEGNDTTGLVRYKTKRTGLAVD